MRSRFLIKLKLWESQLKLPGIKYVTVFIKFVDFSDEKQQNCRKLYNKKNYEFSIQYTEYSIAKFGIPSLDTSSYPK